MTDWGKVLEYEKDVREIASKLAYKINPSLREDVIQHTFMVMHQKLDVTKATGPEREYVRGAIWNIVQRFFRDEKKYNQISVDELVEGGVQITESYDLIWGSSGDYSGGYTEKDE